MKKDPFLDRYIRLLEQTANRAHKDLERERKRVDFIEGKVERLELVVMAAKSDAGREFADRTDRVAAPIPRKPPIQNAGPRKLSNAEIREKWDSLTEEQQQKAIDNQDLVVETKGRPS